jgi:hypothetical protein
MEVLQLAGGEHGEGLFTFSDRPWFKVLDLI